jgi:hypothetical protein
LDKSTSALLFSAASGGISGWQVHFALLRPGTGKDLEDLFFSDISISNQSQYAFWKEPSISASQVFVTAEYVPAPGPGEGRYGEHRYILSAYVRTSASYDADVYYLEDRYMTVRRYDLNANADALANERQEILARLKRVTSATRSQH